VCGICTKSYLREHDLKRHSSEVHRNKQNQVQIAPTIFVPNIPAGPSTSVETEDLWGDIQDEEYVKALDNFEGKIFIIKLYPKLLRL